ncbi:MAG: SRPBCC family protein [Actinomycetia bacterium]|nr:SRPBCC family protein [Actinomycetes bacterium]
MSEQTSSTIVIEATAAAVMSVIADLESYPEWTGSVRSVEVLARDDDGRPTRATFVLDAGVVKDTYTLQYTWSGAESVSWTLVEAQMLTAMDGSYRLTDHGEAGTGVEYVLTLDLKMPMIGLLRRKAEKVVTDTALKELKRRVEGAV